jgi:hypothetical protein
MGELAVCRGGVLERDLLETELKKMGGTQHDEIVQS